MQFRNNCITTQLSTGVLLHSYGSWTELQCLEDHGLWLLEIKSEVPISLVSRWESVVVEEVWSSDGWQTALLVLESSDNDLDDLFGWLCCLLQCCACWCSLLLFAAKEGKIVTHLLLSDTQVVCFVSNSRRVWMTREQGRLEPAKIWASGLRATTIHQTYSRKGWSSEVKDRVLSH